MMSWSYWWRHRWHIQPRPGSTAWRGARWSFCRCRCGPSAPRTGHAVSPADCGMPSEQRRRYGAACLPDDIRETSESPEYRTATTTTLYRAYAIPSVLWHHRMDNRKGIWPVKISVLVCWWWQVDCSFGLPTAPGDTITTSIIHSSNKMQNGDIQVLDNPGPPGKWPLKHKERCSIVVSSTVRAQPQTLFLLQLQLSVSVSLAYFPENTLN